MATTIRVIEVLNSRVFSDAIESGLYELGNRKRHDKYKTSKTFYYLDCTEENFTVFKKLLYDSLVTGQKLSTNIHQVTVIPTNIAETNKTSYCVNKTKYFEFKISTKHGDEDIYQFLYFKGVFEDVDAKSLEYKRKGYSSVSVKELNVCNDKTIADYVNEIASLSRVLASINNAFVKNNGCNVDEERVEEIQSYCSRCGILGLHPGYCRTGDYD